MSRDEYLQNQLSNRLVNTFAPIVIRDKRTTYAWNSTDDFLGIGRYYMFVVATLLVLAAVGVPLVFTLFGLRRRP